MITLVGSTVEGGFVSSVTVPVPAGVEPGDRLVIFASANDQVTITSQPSEWAVLLEDQIDSGTNTFVWVYTHTVVEEDPAQYTVTWEGSHWHFLHVVAFRGVDRIRTQAHNTGASTASLPVPVVDARSGDHLLLGGFHWSEVEKRFDPPGDLAVIDHMLRGWVTGHQPLTTDGDTPAYSVTDSTLGLMCTVAVALVPSPSSAAPIGFPLKIRTEIQTPSGWVEISSDVRDDDDVTITRGRADEASTADASQCTLTLNNRHGRYSPRNPLSPFFEQLGRNTPLRVSLVGEGVVLPRFAGEVAEWPVKWDLSGNDVYVPLVANGPLRRINQGDTPARSALRRFINARAPVAYWPLTDGADAVVAAPDVGPYPMAVLLTPPSGSLRIYRSRMDWRDGTLAPWLEPVARTREDQGYISGRVSRDDASTSWAVDMVRAGAGGTDRFVALSRHSGDGTTQEWRVRFDHPEREVTVWVRLLMDDEPLGTFDQLGAVTDARFFADQPRHVRLRVLPEGSECAWALFIDGDLITSGTTSGFEPPRPVSQVQYMWDQREDTAPDGEHAAIGHIAVWDESGLPLPPSAWECAQAMDGHQGERAGARIERIAREEGVALDVTGDLEDTPRVGPQEVAEPLEVMRDAEQVDDGVLYESRNEIALAYRTGRSRYTQRRGVNAGLLGGEENGDST